MISIMLTEQQTAIITELFDAVDRAYEAGNPGMIAGQFFRSDNGEGFMDVGFLDGDKAKAMLQSMGLPADMVAWKYRGDVHKDIEP